MTNQQAVQYTASPAVSLAVGRYSFPQSNAILYVYPSNVVWFSRSGQLMRMLPVQPVLRVQLKSSMRDI